MKVAYLGPPGTFGEEAARRMTPGATHLPFPSHAAVAAAVESGAADLGVVAIENALSGSVAETLDILIHDTNVEIQSEFVLPVVHNVVVTPGAALTRITVIYSHTQVFGQCRRYIEATFPNAQVEAALSTSEAVERALKHGPQAAAIATERAAELHGGEILARGIQDVSTNATRFLLLGRGRPAPTGNDRTSIAFWFANDRPGSLAGVLNEFASRQINCTKIESRPTRTAFGEYVFLIDFEGHRDEPAGRQVLAAIAPRCSRVKVFGSYPRHG